MQGFIETASVILNSTREVELKEGDVRRIVNSVLRKYTNRFNTEYAQRIELILDVAQKNPNYPAEDIVGEIAAVMKLIIYCLKTENALGSPRRLYTKKLYRSYVRRIILRLYLLHFFLQSILCNSSLCPPWE